MHDLAAAYAVDAVDPEERAAFEAHLESCAQCRREVQELQDVSVLLSEDLEVEPPAQLRTTVLDLIAAEAGGQGSGRDTTTVTTHEDRGEDRPDVAQVTSLTSRRQAREQRRRARPGRWLAAAAAAVVLAGGVWGVSQALNPDAATQVIRADDASEHTADTADGPLAVVVSATEGRAVVQLPADFAGPQAGSVYQAWFVGADGSARSAGVLQPEMLEEGQALLEGSPDDAVAVGFTVEPTGGSTQPTTDPFVVVPLT
ncbi:anti-sigma factor domain-containing protein [Serinicoccus hydrothermalis]|nr:anti-sigma factor [Serinicoccus hydrothermalis]